MIITGTGTNPVKQWCDSLEADTAQVFVWYNEVDFAGAAAVTCYAYGNGRIYCIGMVGMQSLYDRIA